MGMSCYVPIFHFPIPRVRSLFPVPCFSNIPEIWSGAYSERFSKEGRGVNPLFAPSDLFA